MPKHIVSLPDRTRLLMARKAHLRAAMLNADIPALLEIGPSHIVYATGASNMQLLHPEDAGALSAHPRGRPGGPL